MNKENNEKILSKEISAMEKVKAATEGVTNTRKDALDDESRVKVLSPGMLVFKRFVRNKLAIVGFSILVVMFLFSFVGPFFSPYTETQLFTREEMVYKDFANAKYNNELLPTLKAGITLKDYKKISPKFILAKNNKKDSFVANKVEYSISHITDDVIIIGEAKEISSFIVKGTMVLLPDNPLFTDEFKNAFDEAISKELNKFTVDKVEYTIVKNKLDSKILVQQPYALLSKKVVYPFSKLYEDIVNNLQFRICVENAIKDNKTEFNFQNRSFIIDVNDEHSLVIIEKYKDEIKKVALVTDLIVTPSSKSEFLSMDFVQSTMAAIRNKQNNFDFVYQDDQGNEKTENFRLDVSNSQFTIKNQQAMLLYDTNGAPSKEHWCGTDNQGMDVLTRLMYGGRISLMVGFVVVFLEVFIGIVFGGISGYFGGWVDNFLMRFIDLFNSIPSFPLMIIIGSVMDTMEVPSTQRIFLLMLLLGLLGWTGIARVVRGQILMLREQDFMVATESTGLSVGKRIFRHLVPNVMPLLIVQATMSLGSIIIYEATLSFLGLGVKPPLASWGSIVNAANDLYVMKTCWWIWIPTGLLIVLTVLGFNFVGDGLRDAYDPKMKR